MRQFKHCDQGCTQHSIHVHFGALLTPVDADGRPLDTKGLPILTCIKPISDGGRMMSSHVCGKYLKGHPEFPHLCGTHVSAILRRRTKSAERDRVKAQREEETERESLRLKSLNDRLGICSTLEMRYPRTGPEAYTGAPSGRAHVEIEQLEKLAVRIESLEAELKQLRKW